MRRLPILRLLQPDGIRLVGDMPVNHDLQSTIVWLIINHQMDG